MLRTLRVMLLKYRENTAKTGLLTHHNPTIQNLERHWRKWSTISNCECSSVHVMQMVIYSTLLLLLFLWRCGPTRAKASSFLTFLYHTQRRNTFGRTPLDKWSVRRRNLYMTTHNTNNRQTSMSLAGFEPTIPGGERPQTHALHRAATEIGYTII